MPVNARKAAHRSRSRSRHRTREHARPRRALLAATATTAFAVVAASLVVVGHLRQPAPGPPVGIAAERPVGQNLRAAPAAVPSATVEGPRWSDPATWRGHLPRAGQVVTIPAGKVVVLDTVTPNLAGLVVHGQLLVADGRTSTLNARYVEVSGRGARLAAGSAARPLTGRFTLNLTAPASNTDVMGMGMGTKFLTAFGGGVLDLYGSKKTSYRRLGATAVAGARTIRLEGTAAGWKAGDQVAVAPTDFAPLEAETRRVTRVSGTNLTLDHPLRYTHWGTVQTVSGIKVDERAEVADLNRNILITGATRSAGHFGGHVMIEKGGVAHLSAVELTAMGQLGRRARYPLHFHMLGDARASFVDDVVIHHTFQRGLVVHQTNNLRVNGNVVFDTVGMQYFLEDGVEVGNVFTNNLGMLVRQVPTADSLSKETIDSGDGQPRPERSAVFWVSNRHNVFRHNVAVGVIGGWGYAFVGSDVKDANRPFAPLPANHEALENLPALEFSDNYARTIAPGEGHFNLGYGPEEAGSCVRDGGGPSSVPILRMSAFKCFNAALWAPNDRAVVDGTFADNRTTVVQNQGVGTALKVLGSRIVAHTANDPRHDAQGKVDRGPFGQSLFEATDAGATLLTDTQVVGTFQNPGVNPGFTVPAASGVTSEVALRPAATPLLGLHPGSTTAVTVGIDRHGFAGPVTVRAPDLAAADLTHGLTAAPVTIPAGSSTATLTLRVAADGGATDNKELPQFPLDLLTTAGGRTTVDTFAQVELASPKVVSQPGKDVAAGYDTSSPRGLSAMSRNLGVNLAFDGTDEYAEATGSPAWAEITLDERHTLSTVELWQPAPEGPDTDLHDFYVLMSDFALVDDATPLSTVLDLPFVKVVHVTGHAGTKGSPTVIDLPAGTTARWVRVEERTGTLMRLQELRLIS